MIGTVTAPFSGPSYPAPLSPFATVGFATWAWQAIVVILGFYVIGRLVLGSLLIAIGCRLLSTESRLLLQLQGIDPLPGKLRHDAPVPPPGA